MCLFVYIYIKEIIYIIYVTILDVNYLNKVGKISKENGEVSLWFVEVYHLLESWIRAALLKTWQNIRVLGRF